MLITIIADASYCPDTGVAGYGYWIASERGKKQGSGPMKGLCVDNIVAEMQAVVNALHAALANDLVLNLDCVLIQTDCQSAINSFNKHPSAVSKEHRECLIRLNTMRDRFKLQIKFRHVKGHCTIKEPRYAANNLCDRLARKAMREARNKLIMENKS